MRGLKLEQWVQVKEIFAAALEAQDGQRTQVLEQHCGSDLTLRGAVEDLLNAHDRADSGLLVDTHPAPDPPATAADPQQLGPYALHERLGHGGFGVVYRAAQKSPIQRDVALKLLKRGMDTDQVLARFEQERRTLARLDHPNIAKILDAGAAEDGRPYVVMELIRGPTVVKFCEQHDLALQQRLALFAAICRAVHHAHQRAVIHRDLKPSNVLVAETDGRPVPKIIDFGIAKALADDAEHTQTADGQLLGTPRYMSPEQFTPGGAVDTRTDVYALGVLLCELLTGATPREPDPLRGVSQEIPARRPSELLRTAAGTLAEQRRRLARRIRGDLDRIVLKCVQWEPAQRYDSVAALADDAERWLRHEPVLAAPPSGWYRLRKFIQRNRAGTIAAVVAAVALIAGGVAATVGMLAAHAGRAAAVVATGEAQRQADRAEFVSQFLLDDVLAAADPTIAQGRDITVREMLDLAAAAADERFADDPELYCDLLHRLALTYARLHERDEAERLLRIALPLSVDLYGPTGAQPLDMRIELAALLMRNRDHDEAMNLRAANTADARAALGDDHPITLRARRVSASTLASPELYVTELRAIKRAYEQQHLTDQPDYIDTLHALAVGLVADRRPIAALDIRREATERARDYYGLRHPTTISTESKYGRALLAENRVLDAEFLIDTLARARAVFGDRHTTTNILRMSVAELYVLTGRPDEAIALARTCYTINVELHGADSIQASTAHHVVGKTLLLAKRYTEADPILEAVLQARREQWGPDHPYVLASMADLAAVRRAQGRFDEALALSTAALERMPTNHRYHGLVLYQHAQALAAVGRTAEAITTLEAAIDNQATLFGADSGHLDKFHTALAELRQKPEADEDATD
jgi:tetratricopeptide (TPR) repeat protein